MLRKMWRISDSNAEIFGEAKSGEYRIRTDDLLHAMQAL